MDNLAYDNPRFGEELYIAYLSQHYNWPNYCLINENIKIDWKYKISLIALIG